MAAGPEPSAAQAANAERPSTSRAARRRAGRPAPAGANKPAAGAATAATRPVIHAAAPALAAEAAAPGRSDLPTQFAASESSLAAGSAELLPETAWAGLPGPPTQVFRLQAALDTAVVGVRGTLLALPANAFADADDPEQKPVTGTVEVRLREFYTVADMVLNQLHTASGDKLLETGGMVQLTVRTPDGRPCRLRPGASLLMRVPAARPAAGMQLFSGVATRTGRIDWQRPRRALNIRRLRGGGPLLRGSVSLQRFLQQRVTCSAATLRALKRSPTRLRHAKWFAQRRYRLLTQWRAVLFVDSTGRVARVKQTGSAPAELRAAVDQAVSQLPLFVPGYVLGPTTAPARRLRRGQVRVKPPRLATRSVVPVWLGVDRKGRVLVYSDRLARTPVVGNALRTEFISQQDAQQRLGRLSQQEANAMDAGQMGGYLFAATDLGWINCDQFYYSPQPKIQFTVRGSRPDEVVSLVFRNIRAVMAGQAYDGGHVFHNIPRNEPVTVVALRRRGTQLELALQTTTVDKAPLTGLSYQPVTPEQLRVALAQLNGAGQPAAPPALSRR
ncbi:hypothetical protein DLM85_22725 [Hymenobacter edaphi]|uniref:Uncharacterized protein n=1 Tax=Hymenobacter edaphi TaxID=2211146 RepID=A0A328B9T1_9BACT|nr:hypothetical protein DLM85_22725 [Hymenobacter edaphi]